LLASKLLVDLHLSTGTYFCMLLDPGLDACPFWLDASAVASPMRNSFERLAIWPIGESIDLMDEDRRVEVVWWLNRLVKII
jgi:hypothetical protein